MLRGRKPIRLALAAAFAVVLALVAPSFFRDGAVDDRVDGRALASISGRILFGHAGDVWVAEAGGLYPLTQGGRYWGQPDWGPDGTQVVLVGWSQNASDLFVVGDDGSGLRQITRSQQRRLVDNDWVFSPRWSPDGSLIAFLSDRSAFYPMLWIMRPDGTGPRALLQPRGSFDAVDTFTWSPDGTRIAATRFDNNTSQIWVLDLAAPARGRAITSEPGGAFDPSWSPDGSQIAYAAREGRRTVLKVIDAQGGPATTVVQTDLARSPEWSPSGTALAYVALQGRDFEVFSVDLTDRDGRLTASRPNQLTSQFGIDATSGLSWGP
jgi:Tol biopolymer transport system component